MWPTVMLVFNASSVAVLWFGAHRVASGALEVGALIAYLSYLMQILVAVMMTTFLSIIIPRAAVCAERIVEVLDTEPRGRATRVVAGRAGRADRRASSCAASSTATPARAAPVLV